MKWFRVIFTVVSVALGVTGCAIEPELHLRTPVETRVELVTEINVKLMWQVNWEALWQFNWNVSALGPVGYSKPGSMRLHMYPLDAEGKPESHSELNFVGTFAQMEVFIGTYNFLFHNNDSEALLFASEGELADIYCSTRVISSGLKDSLPVQTLQQKSTGYTKAGELGDEPVSLQPDGLFSLFDQNRIVSDDPEYLIYENGKYILRIEGELLPATFIYLIQVKLRNNNGRVVGSSGGAAITGMADGVNLMTRNTVESTVSVPMDVYMDKEQDMLGAKVYTFGIPGCNPYEVSPTVKADADGEHYLVLNVTYMNSTYRNIRINITDQVRALPTGGVITLELDVDDFPPEGGGSDSGGFNALIDEWNEETGETTIIN